MLFKASIRYLTTFKDGSGPKRLIQRFSFTLKSNDLCQRILRDNQHLFIENLPTILKNYSELVRYIIDFAKYSDISDLIFLIILETMDHLIPYEREDVTNELFKMSPQWDNFLAKYEIYPLIKPYPYMLQRYWLRLNNRRVLKQMTEYFNVPMRKINDFDDTVIWAITKNTIDLHIINDFIQVAFKTGLITGLKIQTLLALDLAIINDNSFSLREQSIALNYIADHLNLNDINPPEGSAIYEYFTLLRSVMTSTTSYEQCRSKRAMMRLDPDIVVPKKYDLYNVIRNITENTVIVLRDVGEKPVVNNNTIYYSTLDHNNRICRASDVSGYEIWNFEINATNIVFDVDVKYITYVVDKKELLIVDKNTGELVWTFKPDDPIEYIGAAKDGGFFFVTSHSKSRGSADLWYMDLDLNLHSKPVPKMNGTFKFYVSDNYCVVTAATQNFLVYNNDLVPIEFTWNLTTNSINQIYFAIHDNTLLYQTYENDHVYVSCVDIRTKKMNYVIDDTRLDNHPMITHDTIVARVRHGYKYRLQTWDFLTGELIWSQPIGQFYDNIIVSDKISILRIDGGFYQVSIDTGEVIMPEINIEARRARVLVGAVDGKVVLYSYSY